MAQPNFPRAGQGLSTESLWDYVVANQRLLTYIGGAVVVAAGVVLFWRESVNVRNTRAQSAFESAQQAFYAGNLPLAKSDLDKLISRYGNTPGGVQATMLLAQILYGEGKYDDGIRRLQGAQGQRAAHRFAASVEELLAAGYVDTKRYDEAVSHFLAAAQKAAFEADRDSYLAEAARVYQLAGKTAEARKIWAQQAEDIESPAMSEARVRLGEIDAKAAVKN